MSRCEYNIKMDIRKIGLDLSDWVYSPDAGFHEFGNKTSGLINGREFLH